MKNIINFLTISTSLLYFLWWTTFKLPDIFQCFPAQLLIFLIPYNYTLIRQFTHELSSKNIFRFKSHFKVQIHFNLGVNSKINFFFYFWKKVDNLKKQIYALQLEPEWVEIISKALDLTPVLSIYIYWKENILHTYSVILFEQRGLYYSGQICRFFTFHV